MLIHRKTAYNSSTSVLKEDNTLIEDCFRIKKNWLKSFGSKEVNMQLIFHVHLKK